jgi:hypothetical protein
VQELAGQAWQCIVFASCLPSGSTLSVVASRLPPLNTYIYVKVSMHSKAVAGILGLLAGVEKRRNRVQCRHGVDAVAAAQHYTRELKGSRVNAVVVKYLHTRSFTAIGSMYVTPSVVLYARISIKRNDCQLGVCGCCGGMCCLCAALESRHQ